MTREIWGEGPDGDSDDFGDDDINAANRLAVAVRLVPPFDTLVVFETACHFSLMMRSRRPVPNPHHQTSGSLRDQAPPQFLPLYSQADFQPFVLDQISRPHPVVMYSTHRLVQHSIIQIRLTSFQTPSRATGINNPAILQLRASSEPIGTFGCRKTSSLPMTMRWLRGV